MAKAAKPYMGVFENMEFPEYVFREYPKVVGYRDDKKVYPILVNDPREEVDFITKGSPGKFTTREDALQMELEKQQVELQQARDELARIKLERELAGKTEELAEAKAEAAEAVAKPAPLAIKKA